MQAVLEALLISTDPTPYNPTDPPQRDAPSLTPSFLPVRTAPPTLPPVSKKVTSVPIPAKYGLGQRAKSFHTSGLSF